MYSIFSCRKIILHDPPTIQPPHSGNMLRQHITKTPPRKPNGQRAQGVSSFYISRYLKYPDFSTADRLRLSLALNYNFYVLSPTRYPLQCHHPSRLSRPNHRNSKKKTSHFAQLNLLKEIMMTNNHLHHNQIFVCMEKPKNLRQRLPRPSIKLLTAQHPEWRRQTTPATMNMLFSSFIKPMSMVQANHSWTQPRTENLLRTTDHDNAPDMQIAVAPLKRVGTILACSCITSTFLKPWLRSIFLPRFRKFAQPWISFPKFSVQDHSKHWWVWTSHSVMNSLLHFSIETRRSQKLKDV